jgi:RNA recognition motif-containing protein
MMELEDSKKWSHDKYDELVNIKDERSFSHDSIFPIPNYVIQSNYIFISNLGDKVSKDDLCELFTSVGPLNICRLRYDKSGRMVGMADIVFEKVSDARRAYDKYKNARLDGRPIIMELKSDKRLYK